MNVSTLFLLKNKPNVWCNPSLLTFSFFPLSFFFAHANRCNLFLKTLSDLSKIGCINELCIIVGFVRPVVLHYSKECSFNHYGIQMNNHIRTIQCLDIFFPRVVTCYTLLLRTRSLYPVILLTLYWSFKFGHVSL